MKHLDVAGENINSDIATLVHRGLSVEVQRALDVVRVIGNHAVHPGTLDLDDDYETAFALLNVVNVVVQECIGHKRLVDELYASLPVSSRRQIERRDSREPES